MNTDPNTAARRAAVRKAKKDNPNRLIAGGVGPEWDAYARAIDAIEAKYGPGPNWGSGGDPNTNVVREEEGEGFLGFSFPTYVWIIAALIVGYLIFRR